MTSPHAFVTGAGGFVGSHLVRELLSSGWSVTALVRRPEQVGSLAGLGASTVVGDLNDRRQQINRLEPGTAVFHLAAAMTTLAAGVDQGRSAVENLITLMGQGGARRLILVSSATVHGPHPGSRPVDETTALGPHPTWNHYVSQKLAVEALAMKAHDEGNLAVTIIRPTRVIGPGDPNLVPFVARLQTSIAGAVAGDDDCRHPVVVVDDLARGLVACAGATSTEGNAYYVSSMQEITKRELIDAFVSAGMLLPQRPAAKSLALAIGQLGLATTGIPWRLRLLRSASPRESVIKVLEKRAGRPVDHDCGVSSSRALADFKWRGSEDLQRAIAESVRWHRLGGVPVGVLSGRAFGPS